MRKQILIIICLVFSGFCRAEDEGPAMEKLIDSISELAGKVLDAFGSLSEPFVKNTTNENEPDAPDNTYFVSFLLRGGKNKTLTATDITPKKRMVVNNNFSGEKMKNKQTFIESGPSAKQQPSHNIQLLSNPGMQAMNPPSQMYQPQVNQPYPKKIQPKPSQPPRPKPTLI